MAPTPSIHVHKSFTYRGGAEIWSNGYHFDGHVPTSQAEWDSLFNGLAGAEKLIYDAAVTIVGATGYTADGTPSAYETSSSVVGTLVSTGISHAPGYNTMNVRYTTTQRDSRGHPIYLRNFYHGCLIGPGGADNLLPLQHTALEAYAGAWVAGFPCGAFTVHRAGPNGAVAQSHLADNFIGHRILKRRG